MIRGEDFKIGDRVVVVDSGWENKADTVGMCGDVVFLSGNTVGVRHDYKIPYGHDLSGACEDGFGFAYGTFDQDTLRVIDRPVVQPSDLFEMF